MRAKALATGRHMDGPGISVLVTVDFAVARRHSSIDFYRYSMDRSYPMGSWVIHLLHCVIVILLAGLVLGQVLIVPLIADELAHTYPEVAYLRGPVLVLVIAGIGAVEVALACIWRLLTMVDQATVFTHRAFRYVDVIIGCAMVATGLAIAAFVILTAADAQQPGVMLVVLGAIVGGTGAALLVVVLRALLARAVTLEVESDVLRAELGKVI